MKKYIAEPGTNIHHTCIAMVKLAKASGEQVRCKFNDRTLTAHPNSKAADIEASFYAALEQAREEYLKTPEGQASERKQKEYEKESVKHEAIGLLPFAVLPEKQADWDKCVANNNDPYGACTVRYAARWANYMEAAMKEGQTIAQCADKCRHDCDKEGITGFMYGCAVSMLAGCWKHGEALRLWHNLKTQIGKEGEKANETGGVLNPALLTIGSKDV